MTRILVRPANLRPIANSSFTIYCQKAVRSRPVHAVEIVGYLDLPGEEPKAKNPTRFPGIQRHDLGQQLAGLGDDERLALAARSSSRDRCVLAS